ncbi:MarR family transcriptional regulator [Streptomyces sioyaensis]|uniref:MarR family transcriptional regulator n=1 Tax=Streptomyces sioyaensis TaxID=67364 RepID=UPI0037D2793E
MNRPRSPHHEPSLEELRWETAEELQAAGDLLIRQLRQAAAGQGVTMSQVTVLKRLEREGPSNVADLARAEKVRHQSMLASVNALDAAGLVSRSPHSTDKRQVLITLTEEGRKFLRERHQVGYTRLARLMAERLTPAEQRMLAKTVSLIRRLAED